MIQRRQDGSVDFNQLWDDYRSGFGNLNGECVIKDSVSSGLILARRNVVFHRCDVAHESNLSGFFWSVGEFWLGLEKIYRITEDQDFILRIQMSDWRDEQRVVQYRVRLGGVEENYSLRILESPAGNLESALSSESSSGLPFSTRDRDNDQKIDLNCAKHLSGECFIIPEI